MIALPFILSSLVFACLWFTERGRNRKRTADLARRLAQACSEIVGLRKTVRAWQELHEVSAQPAYHVVSSGPECATVRALRTFAPSVPERD